MPGFKVTVIEISPKMIEVAKNDNPKVDFIEGDFLGHLFTKRFDAIFGMAFIHLFPKEDAIKVFEKCYELLEEVGLLYIGTTKSEDETEGWEEKKDYDNPQKRYRKHWTQEEFEKVLEHTNFEILELKLFSDPYGKTWMDYVLRKKR